MKPILLVVAAFAFLSGNIFAQQYDGIKLSTDKPETAQKISFVYTGIFAKKVDPRINLYYVLKADSTLAFSLKPDNNLASKEVFIFNVFKNGNEVKGALIASALLYTGGIYNDRNYKKAYDLYNQGFLRYPELKPKYLLNYYQAVYSPFLTPNPAISEELEKTWADSLAYGKSEEFINHLAQLKMRPGNSPDPELIKKAVLAKYPNGDFAFSDDVKDLIGKIKNGGEFPTALTTIELKYVPQLKKGGLDFIYLKIGEQQFIARNIAGGEDYLLKIRSNQVKKQLYLFAANLLLKNNGDLQKADNYIQQAIVLVMSDKQPYYVFDKKDWQKTLDGYRGSYLDISAQIQYQSGNRPGAIDRLKTALQINDYDEKIKEHYVKYLLEAGQAKEALAAASQYVIKQKATDSIQKTMREAYINDKGSAVGYDVYYNSLLKESDEQYTIPEYRKFNAPAVDFMLKGIDGNMVSLSSFKGKTIVLYFFSVDFNNTQLIASNIAFDQFVKSNKDDSIVFLAIDNTAVSEADEANGKPLRIQKLNEYMAANKFSFKILLDDFKPNPIPNRGNYYVVADDYSTGGGGILYVIDKNGVVKYNPPVYASLTRALTVALKLVK